MKKIWTVLVISFSILMPEVIYAEQSQCSSDKLYSSLTDEEPQVQLNVPSEPLTSFNTGDYSPAGIYSAQSADELQVQIIVPSGQIASADKAEPANMVEVASLPKEEAMELSENDDPALNEPTFDVPITLNEKVEAYIHYFTNRIRDRFSTWLARSEKYLPMMKKTFKEKGLPEDLTYIALIESGFNDRAYSRSKAVGQWQFIKGTGKRYGLRIDNWLDERRDPEKATEAAAQYLGDLYGMFNDWYLAAAGYNAGEGKIMRAIGKYDTNDFWALSDSKRRYLKRETKDYVPKFIAAALIAKEPSKYGFDDIEYHPSLAYEKITVNRTLDLRDIARFAKCDLDELKSLNPELKTNITPPNYPGYQLKVPLGKKEIIESSMQDIPAVSQATILREGRGSSMKARNRGKNASNKWVVIRYVVKKGDTIDEIASRYNVKTRHLVKWNKLRGNQLKAGTSLRIYVENLSNKKVS